MPAKLTRHTALTETAVARIDAQEAKGEYASTSDLIRTAIGVLRVQEEGEPVQPASAMSAPRVKGPA